MKRLFTLMSTVGVLLVPASLIAKGPTTKIVITDIHGRSHSLVEPAVLARFNVWDGPGTFSGPPNQQTEATIGFIADWAVGALGSRPSGLPRFEVQFFVRDRGTGPERLAYVVLYERDPRTGEGFVYLPGKADAHFHLNVRTILRGASYEGHWFRANQAWQQATNALHR